MKKYLWGLALALASIGVVRAESLCTDWGAFNLCVPVTTGIETAYGYDFKGKQSQGLASTSFAFWNVPKIGKLDAEFGGIVSEFDKGAPFVGVGYQSASTAPLLSQVHLGVYGGKNWNDGTKFLGLKAAIQFITPK